MYIELTKAISAGVTSEEKRETLPISLIKNFGIMISVASLGAEMVYKTDAKVTGLIGFGLWAGGLCYEAFNNVRKKGSSLPKPKKNKRNSI